MITYLVLLIVVVTLLSKLLKEIILSTKELELLESEALLNELLLEALLYTTIKGLI